MKDLKEIFQTVTVIKTRSAKQAEETLNPRNEECCWSGDDTHAQLITYWHDHPSSTLHGQTRKHRKQGLYHNKWWNREETQIRRNNRAKERQILCGNAQNY